MVKSLITKLGVIAVMAISPILYSGCVESTSKRDKKDSVTYQLEQKDKTGDYKTPVIPSQLKIISF